MEAHGVRLGDTMLLWPGVRDHALHLLDTAPPLAGNADARILELIEVYLAFASVLDLVKDDVGVGGGKLPFEKEIAVLAELHELLALQILVPLAERLEGLLEEAPVHLLRSLVVKLVDFLDALPPSLRIALALTTAGLDVGLILGMSASVCSLVVMKPHVVSLGGARPDAKLQTLGDRSLHGTGRGLLLLSYGPEAILEGLEFNLVLTARLVLGEDDVHFLPRELAVEELAVNA
mmetsp:Transcript_93848/g.265482  ORF Transcript_93848/g.265482 Transcript_93848/m.265482 type:complete len:234 (-) Transcript_93848:430-1131(-)